MEMRATLDLVEEHGGIMLALRVMEAVAGKLKNQEEVKKDDLFKIVEFLKNFADKCHHGKEEGILFPEAAKALGDEKMINELLGEHKSARDYIRGMTEALENSAAGAAEAWHVAVNMEGYIRLLTEHIKKENTRFFPLVNEKISEEVQEQIKEKYESLEKEVIGEGKHEEYHGWLGEWEKNYLAIKPIE